jgi:hypothetical protein
VRLLIWQRASAPFCAVNSRLVASWSRYRCRWHTGGMADLQTGDEATATARNDAVRWLRVSYRAGAVVDALATVSMIFPRRLWSLRFKGPFDRSGAELRYGLRAGAPLMAGWTVLLLWADRRPVERKDVIAMTAVPVVAGLMANDAWAVRKGQVDARSVLPVRALQSGLLALFAASYVRAVLADRKQASRYLTQG